MEPNRAKAIFQECQHIGLSAWEAFFSQCQQDPAYPRDLDAAGCPSTWFIRTLTTQELNAVRNLFIFEFNVLEWRRSRGIVSGSDGAEFAFVAEMLSHIEDEQAARAAPGRAEICKSCGKQYGEHIDGGPDAPKARCFCLGWKEHFSAAPGRTACAECGAESGHTIFCHYATPSKARG